MSADGRVPSTSPSSFAVSGNTSNASPSPRTWCEAVTSSGRHGVTGSVGGSGRLSSRPPTPTYFASGPTMGSPGFRTAGRVPLPISLPFEKPRSFAEHTARCYQRHVSSAPLLSEALPSAALPQADQALSSSTSASSLLNASSPPEVSETTPSASWLGSNTTPSSSSPDASLLQASAPSAFAASPPVHGGSGSLHPVPDHVVPRVYFH